MKFFLSSAGIRNETLRHGLIETLGKPIEECTAVFFPTGGYGFPNGEWRVIEQIKGPAPCPMADLPWKKLSLVELTALPTLNRDLWVPVIENADVLLVPGGNPYYTAYWMHESGVTELLPSLRDDMVWFGFSAGSMVTTLGLGEGFSGYDQGSAGSKKMLELVPFSICPHMDHPDLPDNSMEEAQKWAATITWPGYGIDDDTAIRVVNGEIDVVSEGTWKLFNA